MRIYSFTEISMLLEVAGFIVVGVFRGFDSEKFNCYHNRMLILSQVLDMEDE